ncbi:MAG TPA: phosphoglucosamine mutase [Casimicrobiaceae bacterium]|jgi:phosphoglucosamine mutase|nr:phosphoglucosamine mutase [Casimicrobiaceae bacterium]
MTRQYFGTDGVRGRVGDPPITPELVLKLGWAAGRVLAAEPARPGARPAVLIGKDTRISGYLLEAALESGLSAAGVDVYLSGPLPTPAVAYLTRALRLSAGIVVSASHNPFDDNGIKFFGANGAKLPDAVEHAIERTMAEPLACVASADLGKARRIDDAAGRYIEFCKSTFPYERDLKGLRLVVDCAHGAGYHVAPPVFDELGADVIAVGAEPNGTNINEGVGATHPEHLRQAVLEHRADLGIALDGDGDRLLMADGEGRLYDGDQLLYVIAADYLARGALGGGGVVGTLMSNLGFEQALARAGIALERAPVGDRYVLERMIEKKWQLGGENSGHLLCLDKHTTGDAIVAALAVLRALNERDATLAAAAAPVTLFPQRLINVRLPKGFDWKGSAAIRAAEADARASLGQGGRILLRPSGTEPVLRVMVEAADRGVADRCAQRVADSIAATLATAAD